MIPGGLTLMIPGLPRGAAVGLFVLKAGDTMTGSLLPTPTGTLNLGSATQAWATTFTRAVRSDNDQGLTLSTVATSGSGPTLTIAASDAVAGTGNGGQITLQPGHHGGTGTKQGIVLSTNASSQTWSLRPDTTNVVSLGTTALAYAAVYSRILQADTGQNLLLRRDDGTTWATFATGSQVTIAFGTTFLDTVGCIFGTGVDARWVWATANANNALVLATNVNSAAQSGNVIVTTAANVANEHGLAAVATPRLAIFSAADMSVAGNRTQYVQIYHDGSNGILTIGSSANGLILLAGTVNALALSIAVTGTVTADVTQRINTSGSPTAFRVTGGAHTTLAASTESLDLNFNLARPVQFSTGALTTQRAAIIQAPTYGFVGASTLTTPITFQVTACPTAGTNATFTNPICAQFGGAVTIGATSASLFYRTLDVPAHTVTVTGTTQVTAACGFAALSLGIVTVSDASAVTIDTAATLYIAGIPAGSGAGPATITASYALFVDAGTSRFDGNLLLTESIDSAAVADQVSLGRYDIGAGNTVLALSQETAVVVAVATASTHKVQVRINGASYYILLSNV